MSSVAPGPPHGGPVIYTPENAVEALAHPPAKRRRAKRTEEERIEYLRADPYVAQFEAYRVLCASCNKWIRLRPNSTYCSIPWDAHRKSCLSKKMQVLFLFLPSLVRLEQTLKMPFILAVAKTFMHSKNATLYLQRTPMCANSTPNACCVISAIYGLPSIPTTIYRPCKSGSSIGRLVKNLRQAHSTFSILV